MKQLFAVILALVAWIMSFAVSAQDNANKQSVVVAQSTADGAGGQFASSGMKLPENFRVRVQSDQLRSQLDWVFSEVNGSTGKVTYQGRPIRCVIGDRPVSIKFSEGKLIAVAPDLNDGTVHACRYPITFEVNPKDGSGTVIWGGGITQRVVGTTLPTNLD